MTLLNYTVYCKSCKTTLLPWKIVSVHPPSHTYRSFFDSELKQSCPAGCALSLVHVGKTKDALDLVDPALCIGEVTGIFGNFVKYSVETVPEQEEPTVVEVCLKLHSHLIRSFINKIGEKCL